MAVEGQLFLGDSLKAAGGAIGDLFLKGFDWISNPENSAKVVRFFQDMKTAIDGLWPILDKTFTRLEQLSALAAPLIKATGALASMTGDRKGDPNVQQNGDAGQKAWDGFKTSFLNAFDPAWLVNTITSMFNAVPWSSVWQGLKDSWNAVVSFFQGAVSFFANMWSSIQSAASGAWNGIVSAVSAAISNVVSAIVSGGSQIMAEVGSWPGKIQSFFADAGSWLVAAGQQIVQGLIQGIGSMITSAVAKATELASRVKSAVTGFLGIHSPSTVMADIGGFIGQGLIDGLKSKQGQIEKTAQSIGQSVKDAFDWTGYAQRGIDAGFAFAGANADQLASDLGIGGKGAFSQLAEQGIGFGTSLAGQLLGGSTFNFHVTDVDDAIAIKNNQLNRQALGIFRG